MLRGITMNTPPEDEPHIYAEDDAAIYQGILGSDCVFHIGSCFASTVLSNNKVRIADGVACIGGHMCRQPYAEYEDIEIANGQTGKKRNDIIVAKFVTTGTGGVDTFSLEVVRGTAGTTAKDPVIAQDNIYAAGKVRELPLYRVKLDGLNIVAVEQMFTIIPTIPELLQELNDKYNRLDSKIIKEIEYKTNIKLSETVLGKQVYAGAYEIKVLPNATTEICETLIDPSYAWIDLSDSYIYTRSPSIPTKREIFPLVYASTTNPADNISVRLTDGGRKILIATGSDWSAFSAFIVVKYYKN